MGLVSANVNFEPPPTVETDAYHTILHYEKSFIIRFPATKKISVKISLTKKIV